MSAYRLPRPAAVGPVMVMLALMPALCPSLALADCDPRATGLCRQIDRAQQQASDDQSRLDQIKNQIQDLETKDKKLGELLRDLGGQVEAKRQAVRETQAKIDDTSRRIRFTGAELLRQEAHLAVRQGLLSQRVRGLAQGQGRNYLSVLVTSASFSELVNRIELMQDVVRSDRDLVDELNREHGRAQQLSDQLSQQQKDLAALLQQQQDEQARLESDIASQQQALDYQKQLEDQLGQQRAAMEEELAGLNQKLDTLRQEYQRQIDGLSGGGAGQFIWPLDSRYITQAYGCTDLLGEPYSASCATRHFHTGIDIGADSGTPIYAAAAGVVISAGWSRAGYGNRTMIAHAGGYVTTYNHQSSIAVGEGDTVGQGQVIGYVGSTGYSTGPHLHFEILLNDSFVPPCDYLGC